MAVGSTKSSSVHLPGHVQQLRDKQGWAFHRELAEKYPPVTRLSGPLGVRMYSLCIMLLLMLYVMWHVQQKLLFVHDPKAMHYIAVKEQEIFQEAEWFTRYVLVVLEQC